MPIRHQAFTDPEATTVPTEHRSGVPAQTVRDTDRSPAAIVGALCVAGVAVALMQTIIVPLVPRLPEYLRTSNDNAAWALTATLLAAAVAMPIAGRLGDMYGKRLLLLLSLATVVAGSAVCAMSDTLAPFLVGRGLQGLGMGPSPSASAFCATASRPNGSAGLSR
ncbi:putative major facilitator superfamily transporter [Gordonia araii NBRC 100433]|uniref:Putative major facilitator superfamily transporter n=1 Tax=Gordonia araii NBRC 100433 TaxID=1073574 RepID=G7H6J4_9ACTN|nr:MFS transporter [Gordonia araii]GAB11469.1 putative major facilitator superfamily transporter [Gordonia araii NBRC 100433]